jgi:hypothetical protein
MLFWYKKTNEVGLISSKNERERYVLLPMSFIFCACGWGRVLLKFFGQERCVFVFLCSTKKSLWTHSKCPTCLRQKVHLQHGPNKHLLCARTQQEYHQRMWHKNHKHARWSRQFETLHCCVYHNCVQPNHQANGSLCRNKGWVHWK